VNEELLKPQVTVGADWIKIKDARIFGGEEPRAARLFARRTLALPEVGSVALEPGAGSAEIRFKVSGADKPGFLGRLSAAVGGQGASLPDAGLPPWREDQPVTLHRCGDLISTWEVLSAGRGKAQLRHPGLCGDPAFAVAVEQALRGLPGVKEASATRSAGKLWVSYDPRAVGVADILRAAEGAFPRAKSLAPAPQIKPVSFGVANTSLGLATVGELALPLATPLCAGLLVAANLGTVRDAALQLRRGKFGTPVWTTALLACSIASGQVLAYALTDWSFRYWARRWRKDVEAQTQVFLEDAAPPAGQARFLSAEGVELMTPIEQLVAGQVVSVTAGEVAPADGRVLAGSALVQETHLSGVAASVRKRPGDEVYAGSAVLAGKIELEVLRAGSDTRAARIAETMHKTVAALPENAALTQRSVALVDRTVPPTLATAGVGLVVGDLFTVGAILHQDWLSGADLAVPMETFRDIRLAAGRGALVRDPSALQRFSESKFVVLEDQPALWLRGLDLGAACSRLPDTDALLRHVAGAGLYLGDERAQALARACAERGLVVRQPELLEMDAESVAVRDGKHRIVLRGAAPLADEASFLDVEVDGVEVATLEFRRAARRQAAEAVGRLRRMGCQVFLLSDRPEAEAAALAKELGADLGSGDMTVERKVAFMDGLKRRGVLPVLVGSALTSPALRERAHVSVLLGGGATFHEAQADIVLLGESLDPLADIAELSAENRARILKACRSATLPNILCVVGAFAGLLNGITAGILANIAVFNVYKAATASLRSAPGPRARAAKIAV
jgi:hypothetical protein